MRTTVCRAAAALVVVSAVSVSTVGTAMATVSGNGAANPASQSAVADISIPVNKIVNGEEGEKTVLVTHAGVEDGEYSVKVVARNQSSEHPGSNIIVSSGESSVTVKDVESKKNETKKGEGSLKVENGTIKVAVELGEDKVFSGGVDVVLTAAPVVPKETEKSKEEKPQEEKPAEEKPKEDVVNEPKQETPASVPAPAEQPAAPVAGGGELPEVGVGAGVSVLAAGTSIVGYLGSLLYRRFRG